MAPSLNRQNPAGQCITVRRMKKIKCIKGIELGCRRREDNRKVEKWKKKKRRGRKRRGEEISRKVRRCRRGSKIKTERVEEERVAYSRTYNKYYRSIRMMTYVNCICLFRLHLLKIPVAQL